MSSSITNPSGSTDRSFVSGLSYMSSSKNNNSNNSTTTPPTDRSTGTDGSSGSNSGGSDQSGSNNQSSSNSKDYNPIEVAQELLDFADQLQESAKEYASTNAERLKNGKSKIYSSSVYESPMQSFFDDMYCNGPTTLGTTDDLIKYERQVQQQEKKMMNCGIPESKLRFTTTSFGRTLDAPHVHNNEHRVIGKLHHNDLPFTTTSHEYQILEQIVGPQRLNNSYLRLTSNQFGSRIENKRHVVSMMDRIISSCQRLASELPTTSPTPMVTGSMESTTVTPSSANETTVSSTESPNANASNSIIMNEESNDDDDDDMTSPDEKMTTTSAKIQDQEASGNGSPVSSTTSKDETTSTTASTTTTTEMNPPAELVNPNTTNVDADTDRNMSQNDDMIWGR